MNPVPVARPTFAERARKFIVAAVGVLAMVVSTGVLEEDLEIYVNAVIGVATAFGVYQVKNVRSPLDPNAGL